MNKKFEQQILDYLQGRLTPEQQDKIKQRIESDPEAVALLQIIRAMKDEAAADKDLLTAVQRLIDHFVSDLKKQRSDSPNHGLLTFDSGLMPLPAGIRPATLDSRRLRYAAGELELELSMYPASPETYEIIGQVTGYDKGTELDVALKSGRQSFRERSNPFQVFHFMRIPEGSYSLSVIDPDGNKFEFALDV